MTALTRWNPFREMEELQNRLSNLLDSFPFEFRRNGNRESLTGSQWSPPVDIVEEGDEYLIKAELPGIPKEEIRVTLENGVLTISGERRFEKEEKHRRYHRVERGYGSFVRSFTLPADANSDQIRAEFKDGVLHVHVAKHEKAKPKAIEVKSA